MPLDEETKAWLKANRKPSSKERILTYKGESKSIRQWSEITKLPSTAIRKRLSRGWTVEQALETPVMANQWT